MLRQSITSLLLLLSTADLAVGSDPQAILGPNIDAHTFDHHASQAAPQALQDILQAHEDPVDAFLAYKPDAAAFLAQARLIHINGEPEPRWLTEGDKMRLRRRGKKFMDVTDFQDGYAEQLGAYSGKASR